MASVILIPTPENDFFGCSTLTSVALPAFVTSIGDCALCDCNSLTSVDIPSCTYVVTSIEHFTCGGCSALTSVAIPASVTGIEENAFTRCSSLARVAIHASVTSIWRSALQAFKKPCGYATTWADVELWSWWLPSAELKLWNEDGGWVDSCDVQITTGCNLDHDQMFSGYHAGEVLATLPALEPRAVAVHLWGCEARHGTQPTFPATGRGRSPTGFSTTFGGGTPSW